MTAGEEVGDSAAEIYADVAGTQFYRRVEVLQGFVVPAEAAEGDGAVVETVGEYGIDADRSVEILLRSADVPEVVLGDAAEEESPVVGGVQTGKDVEILDGLGIFAVGQGIAAAEVEDVPVVLGLRGLQTAEKDEQYDQEALHKFPYVAKFF